VDYWGGTDESMTIYATVPELTSQTPLAWRVVVRQPTQQALVRVHDLQRTFLLGALVVTIVFLIFGRLIASAFSRPL
jgi:multidrug efflux pump subunit AcrB